MSESQPKLAERIFSLTNVDAEQIVLGALLIDNELCEGVAEVLLVEDFANGLHARIYTAISTLRDRGEKANPVTLKMVFDQDEALAQVGGSKYLVRMCHEAALTLNVLDYARAIADLAKRRRLIDDCQRCIEDATIVTVERSASLVMEEHEERLFMLAERRERGRGWVSIGEAAQTAVEQTQAAYKRGGQIVGVPTGLIDLDRMLGGLLGGDLVVLAGRPAMGKTALAFNIACHAAANGTPVAVFELEQTAPQLVQREMVWRSGLSTVRQRRGDLDKIQWESLFRAREEVGVLPVCLDDTASLSVNEIRQRARRMRRRQKIGLVVVDHLQLLRIGTGKIESRRIEMAAASRMLKQLAKELDVPVVLLSQLTRAVDQRDPPRPMLSDLLESGDIEANADRVLMLYRQSYYLDNHAPQQKEGENIEKFSAREADWEDRKNKAKGIAEIIVTKDRHGPTGTINVRWNDTLMRFENLVHGRDF
jgi:replicative DNA helicase